MAQPWRRVAAAVGAIAVGSGADVLVHHRQHVSAVPSGTLTHTYSKIDQAILTLTAMKPGDTLNGSLTLTNTGSLPAAFNTTVGRLRQKLHDHGAPVALTTVRGGGFRFGGRRARCVSASSPFSWG